MKPRWMALATFTTLAACGLALADDKDKKDKLDGTWTLESGERNGQPFPDEVAKTMKLTITGEKLKIEAQGNEREGTIKIDASKKPKELDITVGERMTKGIYELDGDTLKICQARPNGDRPTEFSGKEGTNQMLMVLKREKK